MVGDVASALDSLGVRYHVIKGELSDVVWVGDGNGPNEEPAAIPTPIPTEELTSGAGGAADATADATSDAHAGEGGTSSDLPLSPATSSAGSFTGGVPRTDTGGQSYSQGQLCVRLRIDPEGDDASALHISRHAGDVLQFHSFYRDIRNQLAGANGWVNSNGRYEHVVRREDQTPVRRE